MAKRGVIIVAGGSGRRMGGALPKQFMMLDNEPILARSINRMHEALPAAEIVVVLPEAHMPLWENLRARFDVAPHRIVAGGVERFHSVLNGINALSSEVEYIDVHDGVRALVTKRLIIRAMLAVEEHDAVIACTSQLAHVLASSYIRSDAGARHEGLSAGSFRDMTRVAALNDRMWSEIFLDNKDYLIAEIDGLIRHLNDYKEAIAADDREAIAAMMRDSTHKRAVYFHNQMI